jgi:hypothetical protein
MKLLISFLNVICFTFLLFPAYSLSQVVDPVDSSNSVSDTVVITQPSGTTDTMVYKKTNRKNYIPDTLFLKTGDKITGRIMSFEQGRLKIDGQGPGVVSVKWYKISSISGGNRTFKVEDNNGVLYIGKIGFSPDTAEIEVLGKLKYSLLLEDVVRIYPLEAEWYRGIKGSLGAGLNYAKSSDVLTVNAEYNLYYVVKKWRFINDYSFVSTSSEASGTSIRIQTNLQALFALPNRWVVSEINSFSRNDELGIKSRFSLGVGGGNNIVQNEWQRLLLLTGVLLNWEQDIETNNVFSNLEWPATLQHTIYKFAHPNLSSTTSIASFVGITEKGRYRLDANTDITWEFVLNFKLQLSFYYNYDNKNIEGKNTKTDYGSVISLLLDLK